MTLHLLCELFAAEMLGFHIYSVREIGEKERLATGLTASDSKEGKREAGWLSSYV